MKIWIPPLIVMIITSCTASSPLKTPENWIEVDRSEDCAKFIGLYSSSGITYYTPEDVTVVESVNKSFGLKGNSEFGDFYELNIDPFEITLFSKNSTVKETYQLPVEVSCNHGDLIYSVNYSGGGEASSSETTESVLIQKGINGSLLITRTIVSEINNFLSPKKTIERASYSVFEVADTNGL